jgi:hypothetical protein
MMSPYTAQPGDAVLAAETSVGLFLGGMLWFRKLASPVATLFFGTAIALAVIAPVSGDFLTGLGFTLTPGHTKRVLELSAGFATVAALLTRREWLTIVALAGEGVLWKITNYIQDSDNELAAAHLAFFGLLIGIHWRTLRPSLGQTAPESPESEKEWDPWLEDTAAFALASTLGVLVCRGLFHEGTDSADEWGYTFQAGLFAKLRAFGAVPPCVDAFENYWVFEYMGRRFAQYTPGWPLFMAPFLRLHAAWLAGPVSFGILVSGVARLTRRAAAGFPRGATPPPLAHARSAGRFAALAMLLSATLLINAGSRFPHLFESGLFVWAIEALFVIATDGPSRRDQVAWGVLLGACSAMMLSTRPGDGATLGIGLFLYFVYAAVRGRIGWRAFVATAVPFALLAALTLVILKLQVGKWLTTGYSLAGAVRPTGWAAPTYSIPKPNEFRWGIPLGTGAYCWWPCCPAVGFAGLATLRGRAKRIAFVLFFGLIPMNALYVLAEFGRGWDWGYGPRYALPFTVPMAIGTGVVCALVWRELRAPIADRAALEAFPVMILAALLGVVRIAPFLYPYAHADVEARNRVQRALDAAPLHDAIVVAEQNVSPTSPLDITENLPIDLYPDADVLIANNHDPGTAECLREHFPHRRLYRAYAGDPVRIVPLR